MEYGQTAPRALKTANGIQHAEWVLLVSDLQRCLELVGHWRQLLSLDERTPRDTRLAESLFRDAVVSFVSCFDKDKGHVHLDVQILVRFDGRRPGGLPVVSTTCAISRLPTDTGRIGWRIPW